MRPLVSIITPSYNSEKYIDVFFESILNQDYDNYEVIFINDGSTDNTENKVLYYKSRFEEYGIRFVYLAQDNGGQASALNLGFPYIKGKYIIWPDSDDILKYNNISTKVNYMEQHPDIDLGISWAEHVDEEGNNLGVLKRVPGEDDNLFLDLLLSRNVVFCPGIYIMRASAFRDCYPDLRIDESRCGQNYQLLLPLAYGHKYGYIDEILYIYVKHESSHSNAELEVEDVQIRRFEEHERLLISLIDRFCRDEERSNWSCVVKAHYQALYLRIANEHADRKTAIEAARALVAMRRVTLKDCIYIVASLVGIPIRRVGR